MLCVFHQLFRDALCRECRERSRVLVADVESIFGLSVDWMSGNVYWVYCSDALSMRIEVCSPDGAHRKVLVWRDLDEPRAIVVDPVHG